MKGIKILGMQTEIVVILGEFARSLRPSVSCLHNVEFVQILANGLCEHVQAQKVRFSFYLYKHAFNGSQQMSA